VTGHAPDLCALIGLLMLRSIVVTNAIVLRDLTQHKIEAHADLRTVLIQGGRTHVCPILMRGRVGTWSAGSYRWSGRR
jgi:multidrug efflux pump subunit AcrB